MNYVFSFVIFFSSIILGQNMESLKNSIKERFNADSAYFALCFEEIGNSRNSLFINSEEIFHAASTIKTPIMLGVFDQAKQGKFKLTDSVIVKNDFKSIVDSSHYSLDIAEDGGENMYKYIDKKRTIYDIVYDMITVSSNLGTNLLIDLVGADNIMNFLKENSISGITVLRGVEDQKAFDSNLNNTVTAKGLYSLFLKLGKLNLVSTKASQEMIAILSDQKFNDLIPAYLPKDVKVAHKTGSITGIRHDSGIVYLPDGRSYVLVILAKNVISPEKTAETMAQVSKLIFDHMQK